ncbi:MAG: hypothetical protein IKE64_12850 [Thermoguttaceae bacterium]|nr:hypothetical protein [Thermoguttaceae bacterium]
MATKRDSQAVRKIVKPKSKGGAESTARRSGTLTTRSTQTKTKKAPPAAATKPAPAVKPKQKRTVGEKERSTILRGLLAGQTAEAMEERLKAAGLTAAKAKAALREVRGYIAAAATIDAREELGRARLQLEALYEVCLQTGDTKTALATRKEMSKVMRLYDVENTEVIDDSVQTRRDNLIREHLEGLGIAPPGLPLEELARAVALAFVSGEIGG